jgi:lincosamide and streptogramin A transport system ATP-binding/permease protein
LLARSICDQANLYIWDEPLNYIDIFSRMQIEELIKKYNLTMIFVEHDESFSQEIATKIIEL